ncbi:hypothetical protein [Ulvibacterium sp.]|uniref:hypothetical protein n=1 Tax=Ulvibacterium sp. TaxID=2665914 RepID=UPI00262FEFA6|nr:hypothetical protein [Ulvibacterium sp.]
MTEVFVLVLILSSSGLFGQDLTKLNSDLGLTDSLNHESEIRIYKGFGVTNHTGIFRMYQDSSKNWRAEFFDHYAKVLMTAKLKIEKRELTSNKNLEKVWWSLLKTRILDLPDMSEIEWKLKKNPEMVEDMGIKVLSWQKTEILDGESYAICFRWSNKLNQVTYRNPERYLQIYEKVDELIYFNNLLDLIRTEFGIWKNN